MSDHGVRLRYGVALVLGLVCASAALAGGPLFPAQQYDAGDIPWCVAVGDLNGDEWLDLAAANWSSDNVSVLLNQRPMLGDLNCDGNVDFDDIDLFVLALTSPAAYYGKYPTCNWFNADCNCDGKVNFDDIDPFVAFLSP